MDVASVLTTLKNLTNARITKADLARALNMDPAALRRKELACVEFKPDEIKKIETYFDISFSAKKTCINSLERQFDTTILQKQEGLGYRIALIQEKNNLSGFQMAGLLNVSEKELADIIIGKALPDMRVLNNLKQNFKVSIDWVLYGEE